MLKYSLNPKKQRKLLEFWGVSDLQSFFDLPNNPGTFFARYLSLGRERLEVVRRVLLLGDGAGWFSRGRTLRVAENAGPIKLSNILDDRKILEELDSVGLLSWVKDRTSLGSQSDGVGLGAVFRDCLEGLVFLSASPEALGRKSSASLLRKEKAMFEAFKEGYARKDLGDEEVDVAAQLLKKGFLFVRMLPTFEVALVLNSSRVLSTKASPSRESAPKYPIEEVPRLLHKVEHLLYQRQLSQLRRGFQRHLVSDVNLSPRSGGSQMDFRVRVLGRLAHASRSPRWVELDFKQKVNWILQRLGANSSELLCLLAELKDASVEEVCYRRQHELLRDGVEVVAQKGLRKAIRRLVEYGFAAHRKGKLATSTLLASLCKEGGLGEATGKASSEGLTSSDQKIVIDSDATITLYRENLLPSVVYYLGIFLQLSFGDYVIRGSFSEKRLAFSLFCGISPSDIKRILKAVGDDFYSETTSNHIDWLFNQLKVYEEQRATILRTHSKELYRHSVLLLKKELEPKALKGILFLPKTLMLLFLERRSYELALAHLVRSEWIIFR